MALANPLVDLPLLAYSGARSAHFLAQYELMNGLGGLLPGARAAEVVPVVATLEERLKLLQADVAHIRAGTYPIEVLLPESPVEHLLRFPRLLVDALGIYRRRQANSFQEFDEAARAFLDEVPAYYRRNFHFQTNGYLDEASAELYEHQVEMLFGGTADAMRRLMLPPLKAATGSADGQGLQILEIGAGTGRATRFMALAFPKARITAIDLSEPYLKVARRNMAGFGRVSLMQGDGSDLPFKDGTFDAVCSTFMFHEMPLPVRKQVLAESARVLKPGGFLGAVDSSQRGDFPPFDPLLDQFTKDFHEPFYGNYIAHPLEGLMALPGLEPPEVGRGFLSKVVWARRGAG